MVKPNIPNIPGMGAVTDTLDFVKNLWGGMGLPGVNMPGMNAGGLNIPGMGGAGMNIPGMVMPTLSVEEINKKISDLKAVEAWLTLNQNMLRGTIQALEVQAATITTLKTMGETFTASMKAAGGDLPEARTSATSSASSGTSSAASSSSHSAKSFYSPNGNGSGSANGNGAGAAHSGSHANGNGHGNGSGNGSHAGHRQDEDADEPASKYAASTGPTAEDQQGAANLTAPLVNAAAWWNMLQDQFKQAVSSAMVPEPGKDGNATAGSRSREKSDGKPGAKSTSGSAGTKTASKSAAKPATKSRTGSGSTGTSGNSGSSGGTTAKRKPAK
jgi:hypothetical protein